MSLAAKSKPRHTSTIYHKRRTGTHRKQTKPFLSTYWPYLPLLGIAAIVIILGGMKFLGLAGTLIGSGAIVFTAFALAL